MKKKKKKATAKLQDKINSSAKDDVQDKVGEYGGIPNIDPKKFLGCG